MEKNLSLYSRSRLNIWTDEHISKKMLEAHLDYDHDGASRNISMIKRTIQWIDSIAENRKELIDLGCGPGIYTNMLYEMNYKVFGIDISQRSIEYAKEWAKKDNKKIEYLCQDYVHTEIPGKFDIAICIYCDFGALIPEEQVLFLKNISKSLHDDGILIFDVFGEGLCKDRKEGRSWSVHSNGGFWSPSSYIELSEDVHFKDAMVWGNRTVIIDEQNKDIREYISWDSYYNEEKLKRLLMKNGYLIENISNDLIKPNDFTSNDVLFIMT